MKDIVILDAVRTPIGKYRGALSHLSAVDLGVITSEALLNRHSSIKSDISQSIFGAVLTSGLGQNIARQISVKSGISVEVPAFTVNEVCGSGMKAILLARQSLALDEATVVLAGGVESMSNAETMQIDGLTDAFENIPMGVTVERLVKEFNISREAMDAFALDSHDKALKADFSSEIVPVEEVTADQAPRSGSSLEKLASLSPVFSENGTITAATATPVNDGATALLITSREYAEKYDLPYLAIIKDAVEVAVEPSRMAISPIKAISQLLEKTNLSIADIDCFEINEAFAASSIIIEQELGLDHKKVNVKGGAIALGHPLGMSAARITGSLAHQLYDKDLKYGVASLCIGGGLGLAMLLENPNA
ncbi:MAG TPA: thiolase family protein [Lactovum miscens]|uniref:thiolase family protein n=1 Tax=Lactovum miscens TaxID=190387 RepID=UPI002ED86BBF